MQKKGALSIVRMVLIKIIARILGVFQGLRGNANRRVKVTVAQPALSLQLVLVSHHLYHLRW